MKMSHKGYLDIKLTPAEASCLTNAYRIIYAIQDKLSDYDVMNYSAEDILDQFYYKHELSFPMHEETSIEINF